MSSATSRAEDALAAYVAGKLPVEGLIAAVAEAYYRETGRGKRQTLRPLMDVIERAAPGMVELAVSGDAPGFALRAAARPFPKEYEAELRQAVTRVLGEGGRGKGEGDSVWRRLTATLRRWFSASAAPPGTRGP
jgi:hypothetical protein